METVQNMSDEEVLWAYNNDFRMSVLPVTVLFGIESIFGIIGNVLTIYVYSFHYKSCDFRYFVLCLAMTDLASCLTSIPGEMVSQMFWYDYPEDLLPVCKTKSFFHQFTICSEAGLLLIIAVDRYRKVCQPFCWQIKESKAKLLCVLIIVIAIVLAIPAAILWGIHTQRVIYKGRNIIITICERDEKYQDSNITLWNIVLTHILILTTLVAMISMYVMIKRRLSITQKQVIRLGKENINDSSDEHANTSLSTDSVSNTFNNTSPTVSFQNQNIDLNNFSEKESSPRDKVQSKTDRRSKRLMKVVRVRRKTIIMLYLTTIFVTTAILYSSMIAVIADGKLSTLDTTGKVVYLFFLRLYFINYIINPVLYGVMDRQFRAELKRLWKNFKQMYSK